MKGEFEVTEGMQKATWHIAPEPTETEVFRAMTAHPDFQRQLRAWAAEQMRGLVPKPWGTVSEDASSPDWICGHNDCLARTIANIEKWESSND